MDTVRIGKGALDSGNIWPPITLFSDDLSNYTGKDLMFEYNAGKNKTRVINDGEIQVRIATINQNVLMIHNTSNGERDCECYLHLIRMINECGLLLGQIRQKLMNQKIISYGEDNKYSGHIDPSSLASYYSDVFAIDDNNHDMISSSYLFLATRFKKAYDDGFENRIVDLNEEKKLFENFQTELLNNECRKR